MPEMDMPIELKTDFTDTDRDLYVMIEDRLQKLSKNHSDITGAAATIEQPAQGRESSYVYTASIVVYTRPNYINATEKAPDAKRALKGALDAVERQIRDMRSKLKEDRGSLDDAWLAENEPIYEDSTSP